MEELAICGKCYGEPQLTAEHDGRGNDTQIPTFDATNTDSNGAWHTCECGKWTRGKGVDGCQCEQPTTTADLQAKPTPTELDDAILVPADGNDKLVQPADVRKPKAKKALKPKQTPEEKQQRDNIFEAVKYTWRLDDNASWKIAKLQLFFMGTIKKTGKYKDMFDVQLTERPADAVEIVAFGFWYRDEYDGVTLPESGNKLRSHVETFRGSGDRWQTFMRSARRKIIEKVPAIKLPGVVEKQLAPEVVEEELIEVSPEEMKALMDGFGKGGEK
jgi:hypothetical protein